MRIARLLLPLLTVGLLAACGDKEDPAPAPDGNPMTGMPGGLPGGMPSGLPTGAGDYEKLMKEAMAGGQAEITDADMERYFNIAKEMRAAAEGGNPMTVLSKYNLSAVDWATFSSRIGRAMMQFSLRAQSGQLTEQDMANKAKLEAWAKRFQELDKDR